VSVVGAVSSVFTICGPTKMTDKLTPAQRSVNMSRIKSANTAPEWAVRRLIHSMNYRFRLHRKDLPGKPDIVFPGRKKVIFVHGCFWHQHQREKCADSRLPKSNTPYWTIKLKRNVERDKRNVRLLKCMGWSVLTVWDCETRRCGLLSERIRAFLES
jgi:DNA mismatch endonuclease (patch repair protein)